MSYRILCVCVVTVEEEHDVLEEDVFQEEVVSCFLSPLHAESVDYPETPVSSHFWGGGEIEIFKSSIIISVVSSTRDILK